LIYCYIWLSAVTPAFEEAHIESFGSRRQKIRSHATGETPDPSSDEEEPSQNGFPRENPETTPDDDTHNLNGSSEKEDG
jgi:hypothetical protein